MVEYALMLALIALIAVVAVRTLGSATSESFGEVVACTNGNGQGNQGGGQGNCGGNGSNGRGNGS
jgi:Flp pilus assembly pilin Flp